MKALRLINRIRMNSAFKKIFILFILLLYPWKDILALQTYEEVRNSYDKSDSILLDRNGKPLHELRTNYNLRRLAWTDIRDISPAFLTAVIFAEDKRFFKHAGIDYGSIAAAIVTSSGDNLRGASTISMQLAALLNDGLQPAQKRRTIWQKSRQVIEARRIEKNWSKKKILEAYLNLLTFRGEIQGIAAASRGLFGKAPHGLNKTESVILASLIRSPNASGNNLNRRSMLLAKSLSWPIKENEIENLTLQRLSGRLNIKPEADLAPHVAGILLKNSSHGEAISCTLNASIQRFALERLKHHLNYLKSQNVTNGAVIVAENKTGEVLVYVSYAADPSRGRYVDGVRAKRQAGSTLKPFLYALAFDNRILTPASILEDSPVDISVSSGIYRPQNYQSEFNGMVSVRTALASSLNIPAVRALSLVGIEPFLAKLRKLNIQGIEESGDYYGPSAALGSIDVSLWELTNAYRCLANGGTWDELHLTKAVNKQRSGRIYSAQSVFLISDILSDREARSTTFGLDNPLSTRFWSAVKTGTSKDMRDNWCIGYSNKYTVGVWVGNFSGTSMWDVSGISGAAPVWAEIMNLLHYRYKDPGRKVPENIVAKNMIMHGVKQRKEFFIKGTEPVEEDQRVEQLNRKIIYPANGTIIALDPDIPSDLQKVFFISQPHHDKQKWILNNNIIPGSWTPEAGNYLLSLADENGNIIDSVKFEVRGVLK